MLNIDCDRRADDAYTTPFESFRPREETIVPEQAGAVFQSGGIINTSKLKRQIIRDKHSPPLRIYLKKDKMAPGSIRINRLARTQIRLARKNHNAAGYPGKIHSPLEADLK